MVCRASPIILNDCGSLRVDVVIVDDREVRYRGPGGGAEWIQSDIAAATVAHHPLQFVQLFHGIDECHPESVFIGVHWNAPWNIGLLFYWRDIVIYYLHY